MSHKIVPIFAIVGILVCGSPVSAFAEVSRREVISATLDVIEHNQKAKQSPAANFFSDFSIRSPLLDIISLYRSYASPVLCFLDQKSRLFEDYSLFPRMDENDHVWNLAGELSYMKYEEPDVMKDEGAMYGISGSYTSYGLFLSRNFMFALEGKFSCGEVDYQNSGTLNDIEDYMIEVRALGGYYSPQFIFGKFILKPYLGFGYRYLNDDSSGRISSTGAYGYERESNYYYSPFGISLEAKLMPGWLIGWTIEYDHFWMGVQKSHLSDVNSSFNDVENNQDSGFGVRTSLRLERQTEKFDFIIEPFIKYWNIEKSDEKIFASSGVLRRYGYEPKNNSIEIGGKAGVRF